MGSRNINSTWALVTGNTVPAALIIFWAYLQAEMKVYIVYDSTLQEQYVFNSESIIIDEKYSASRLIVRFPLPANHTSQVQNTNLMLILEMVPTG